MLASIAAAFLRLARWLRSDGDARPVEVRTTFLPDERPPWPDDAPDLHVRRMAGAGRLATIEVTAPGPNGLRGTRRYGLEADDRGRLRLLDC